MARFIFKNNNGKPQVASPLVNARMQKGKAEATVTFHAMRGANCFRMANGGANSGNWGHAGRPGERGGAAPGDGVGGGAPAEKVPGGFLHEDKTMRIEPAHASEGGKMLHDVLIKGQSDGQKPISVKINTEDMNIIQKGGLPKQVSPQIVKWGKNDGDLDMLHEKVGYVPSAQLRMKFPKGTEEDKNNGLVGMMAGKAKAYITRARDYAPEEAAHRILLTKAADAMDIANRHAVKFSNREGNLGHQKLMPGAPQIASNIPPGDNDGDADVDTNCANCNTRVPMGKFCTNCGFQHPVLNSKTSTYEEAIAFIRNRK